ncbi:MAG: sensor histidine kinase, partial [Planctomycetota bacterium]
IGAQESDTHWLLWVEDNGPGIPGADRDLVFETFRRGSESTQNNPYSFGLGLAFCRLAAKAHGGSIDLLERPAGGCRFEITIPKTTQPR